MVAVANNHPATVAPCREACPAGIDVPRYIRRIREGRFDEALAVIRERIPFPFVCGYACVHPCEARCSRSQFDEPVAIRILKRAAAELGGSKPSEGDRLPDTGKRAAVVGSGPCGLTAAYYLALKGHRVTVFEALPEAGGMLRYGIPAYRLPGNVLDQEIAAVRHAGVEILTNRRIAAAEALRDQGFDAVLVASGAWRPTKMNIPGEERPEVEDAISFLTAANGGRPPRIGKRVIVVGGGNAAIDAARVARRLGAEVVQLYRRTVAEMPAAPEEVEDALAEGVKIRYLTAPVRIEEGQVTCIRMTLGVPDAGGRPAPVPVAGSEYTLAADTVIVAVGQSADIPASTLKTGKGGTVQADAQTLATSVPGIFAGGDAVTGPASIIEAIAQGRTVAAAMDRYLGGTGAIDRLTDAMPESSPLPEPPPRGACRAKAGHLPVKRLLAGFETVDTAYARRTAVREAERCLSCDLRRFDVLVNEDVCKDCGYCREVCSREIFTQSPGFNPSGYHPCIPANTEKCIGCLRCLYICPDFAITIREDL